MHGAGNGRNKPLGCLVDNGAIHHYLNNRLIAGLKEEMTYYTGLEIPIKITTAGQQTAYGTAMGNLCIITIGVPHSCQLRY